MCGIAGFIDWYDAPDPERLKGMVLQLHHRGPDALGMHVRGPAALGHSRLSIIDLASGAQPMADPSGRWWLTYNGELFNYIELRAELERLGHAFHTNSDTEVVLHQYMEHGPDGLDAMNGQWAFAIWDSEKESLFLARDRFGIRPLHYWIGSGRFVFASEVKSLFAHPSVPRQMDNEAVLQTFRYWAPLPGRTAFRGVNELKPGHWARYDRYGWREERWWRFPLGQSWSGVGDPEAAAEWVREDLRRATRLRLRADVPVGAYVSGGIDSSLLASLIKDENPGMKTFSLRFKDGDFDETRYQDIMARHLRSDHHFVEVSAGDIAAAFPRMIRHAEKPILRTASTPLMLLAAKVREQGIKVVLTGEGADEVMAGYDLFKDAKIRHWWAKNPGSRLRPLLLGRLYPTNPLLAQAGKAEYMRHYYGRWIDDAGDPGFSHRPRWDTVVGVLGRYLSPSLEPLLDRIPEWDAEYLNGLPFDFDDWDQLDRAQLIEAETLLGGYLLSSQGDRPAMSHSVEGRYPYLDPHFVAGAACIPPRLRLPVLREKDALKRAARGTVPDEIMNRPKQPYMAPDSPCFFGNDAPDYVEEMLGESAMRRAGIFDGESVAGLARKLSRRQGERVGFRDNMLLVGILSTQLLYHGFIEDGEGQEGRSPREFHVAAPLGVEK